MKMLVPSELATLTPLELLEAVYLILSHEEGDDLSYARALLEQALDHIRVRNTQTLKGAALADPRAVRALERNGSNVLPHVHCRLCGKPWAGDISTRSAPAGDFRMTHAELIRSRLERDPRAQCECAPPILQLSWDFLDERGGMFLPVVPRARINL